MRRFPMLGFIVSVVVLIAGRGMQAQDVPQVQSSKVTIQAKDTALSTVLAELSRKSGNAPLVLPDDLKGLSVTLQVKDVPYWDALDLLCESAGLIYVPDLERSAVRIDKALKCEDYGARARGVVIKVESMRRLGGYRVVPPLRTHWNDEPRRWWLRPSTAYTSWVLRYFWEDRFPVVKVAAEIEEVTDANRREIGLFQVPPPRAYRVHFAGGPRPPSGTLTFSLDQPRDNAGKLGAISGVVRLSLGVGRKELVLEDVLDRTGQTASVDGLTLCLKKAERQQDVVLMAVDVGITDAGGSLLLGSGNPRFGFYLEGPDGKRTLCEVERETRNLHRAAAAGNRPVSPRHQLTGTITLQLMAEAVDQQAGLWKLVYLAPEKIHEEEIPFRIENIPLQ